MIFHIEEKKHTEVREIAYKAEKPLGESMILLQETSLRFLLSREDTFF